MEEDLWDRLLDVRLGVWHYFLFALIIGLFFKRKQFLVDWGPFFALWVLYDMTRGIAQYLSPIHVKEVYDLEKLLFGWMFGGKIPNEWVQDYQYAPLTILSAIAYAMHPLGPLSVAILIYYKSKDSETWKEFKYAFILTIYSGLVTFALYPVAPPWYVWNNGNGPRFSQPQQQRGLAESAGNLVNFDKFFSENIFGDLYTTFNANPYAAVPSLHAAFAFFAAYYLILRYKRNTNWVWIAVLYPTVVFFAAVYLNHHYIVDLIAGVAYSYTSIRLVRFLQSRNRNRESTRQLEDIQNKNDEIKDKLEDQSQVEIIVSPRIEKRDQ